MNIQEEITEMKLGIPCILRDMENLEEEIEYPEYNENIEVGYRYNVSKYYELQDLIRTIEEPKNKYNNDYKTYLYHRSIRLIKEMILEGFHELGIELETVTNLEFLIKDIYIRIKEGITSTLLQFNKYLELNTRIRGVPIY